MAMPAVRKHGRGKYIFNAPTDIVSVGAFFCSTTLGGGPAPDAFLIRGTAIESVQKSADSYIEMNIIVTDRIRYGYPVRWASLKPT